MRARLLHALLCWHSHLPGTSVVPPAVQSSSLLLRKRVPAPPYAVGDWREEALGDPGDKLYVLVIWALGQGQHT